MGGPLHPRTDRLLRDGDDLGRYRGDFGAHSALVQQLAAAGRLPSVIHDLLVDGQHDGGAFYRGRLASPRDGRRAFRRLVVDLVARYHEQAVFSPPRRPDASDLAGLTASVRAHADRVLTGRTRATDLAAVDAWCARVIRYRTRAPIWSERDIAMDLDTPSRHTAQRVRDRLLAAGVLRDADRDVEGGARAYEAACSFVGPDSPSTGGTESGPVKEQARVPNESDAWRHTRLGKSARLLYYAAADAEPQTQADLARATGLARNTVSRHVPRLVEHGLLACVEGGYVVGPITPEDFCLVHGITDGIDDAARFKHERAWWAYRQQLARLDLATVFDRITISREELPA